MPMWTVIAILTGSFAAFTGGTIYRFDLGPKLALLPALAMVAIVALDVTIRKLKGSQSEQRD